MEKPNTVYIIAGPTAVGKSIIALYLAKRIHGEIVNCDSIQLYKYMDIGSAKPSARDMRMVPHHLYGILDPNEEMSVAQYQKLALLTIDDILRRGKTPILCGGTGLYLNSVLYDMNFAGVTGDNGKRRRELEQMAEARGGQYMYEYLSALDPVSANRIHPHNTRKVIRAIEAYETGSNIHDINECPIREGYDFRLFGITMDRTWLYDRINRRVLNLVKSGLFEELEQLRQMGYSEDSPAMKAIGYRELFHLRKNDPETPAALIEVMKNTRHYAKRQLTWLRRYEDWIHWIRIEKNQSVGQIVDEILETNTVSAAESRQDRNPGRIEETSDGLQNPQ